MPLLGDAVQPVVDPDLLAGRRVQRDQRGRVAAEAVEHVIGEDRAERRRAVRIEPRHLELADVGLGDLVERVEVRAVGTRQRLDFGRRREHAERRDGYDNGGGAGGQYHAAVGRYFRVR